MTTPKEDMMNQIDALLPLLGEKVVDGLKDYMALQTSPLPKIVLKDGTVLEPKDEYK
jgi:hypothetical protein